MKQFARCMSCLLLLSATTAAPLCAQTRMESIAIAKFKDEGMNRSQVMDVAYWLTDRYGPRLTGSPLDSMAGEWSMRKMREWGLSNVHPEPYAFAYPSWQNEKFYMQVTAPVQFPVLATSQAWSNGTKGLVQAPVSIARIRVAEDTLRFVGKVQGHAVLVSPPMEGWTTPTSVTLSNAMLDRMARTDSVWYSLQPELLVSSMNFRPSPDVRGSNISLLAISEFLQRQGAVAMLRNGPGAFGGAAGGAYTVAAN